MCHCSPSNKRLRKGRPRKGIRPFSSIFSRCPSVGIKYKDDDDDDDDGDGGGYCFQ